MRSIIIVTIALFSLIFCYAQLINNPNINIQAYKKAEQYYNDAIKISNAEVYDEAKEIKLNEQALNLFNKINVKLVKGKDDSLAFFCHLKTAILYHYFDSTKLAKAEYFKTLSFKNNKIQDSCLFQPLLFIGRILYGENKFDSSYKFYKQAEAIADKYDKKLEEEERLFNGLGSMLYETGNYKQAKNYYEKALSLLDKKNSSNLDFFIKYKSNIATCLFKLEKFNDADSIYNSLLSYRKNENEIYHNLGNIQAELGNPNKAITYFQKANYNNASYILLQNKIGKSYLQLNKLDSAEVYFKKAFIENEKWNNTRKNNAHGTTFLYQGDKLMLENNYAEAIKNYHKAILQFYPDYTESNMYKNPENFTGVFSYINLFNTLASKAVAFDKLYTQDKKIETLNAANLTYRSAFTLAEYVEKTYDSDEARLFLNKLKYSIHDNPIRISLQLFELTKNKTYLEEAYLFDQQNKASVLSLNIQENAIKNQLDKEAIAIIDKEGNIKRNITRLSIKASQVTDSSQLQNIKLNIIELEIALAKLQDKINNLPSFNARGITKAVPSVKEVQNKINKKTAILSYHLAENELIIFCITKNEITYSNKEIDSSFFEKMDKLKVSLSNNNMEQSYNANSISAELYKTIISPIHNKIEFAKNLIIIPDDELNNLPFEVFMDSNGNFVLEKYKVQYQYSSALLINNFKIKTSNKSTLAMAPFVNISTNEFSKLSNTENEIKNLKGNVLIDSAASKKNFLALAEKSNIIHLATHTIVNDIIPDKSLIAFYPFKNIVASENNLSVQEIYNLKLDATELVVLSACETGTGKLAKGEGLMSLARAFTYAGCPNIISSLWKANDKSTAWIMQRFYTYYNNEDDAVTALQKAKLDYINSPVIEKRFKTPNYWAHLVVTGIPYKNSNNMQWIWIGVVLFLSLILLLYIKKKKKKLH